MATLGLTSQIATLGLTSQMATLGLTVAVAVAVAVLNFAFSVTLYFAIANKGTLMNQRLFGPARGQKRPDP